MDSVVTRFNTQIEVNSTTNRSLETSIKEREYLQVYLRIRPFTFAEIEHGESQDYIAIEPPDTILLKPLGLSLSTRQSTLPHVGQRFQFSQVYGPETTQRQLFQGTVQDLVKDVLDGGHSLLFTYGVTNAGKTFTFLGPDADAGILPRSLQVIFSSIEDQVFSGMSIKPHRCREFTRLTQEQQVEEATFKRNLMRQLKESDKSNFSMLNSTCCTSLHVQGDKIRLPLDTNTKFSVWISFCEIYNENIHDLLEVTPSGAPRRPMLRLSEDVNGNTFVKDLRWVQVNSAEEACKFMKLGKKNQSFSSTKLNQLSSRSHSIFSIRIMKIEDAGMVKVQAVGELCLCDLAGSERCAKTQNKGERLKEAGNINTSLLILGKCINTLRQNQQTKLFQHVPFRESKLTRYLQSFFSTRGKARMIVNINQCASMYDETLNVLKFSAIAQQVMVLSTPLAVRSSAVDSSFNNCDSKAPCNSMRSSLTGWDTSLEDVKELPGEEMGQVDETIDEGDDDDKILVSKQRYQQQVALVNELQIKLKKEQADHMLMETRVREEVCCKFTSLYSEMHSNFESRLARELEMVEERAEKRLNIFKKLIDKMVTSAAGQQGQSMENSLDKYSSGLAELQMAIKAAEICMASDKVEGQGDELSEDLVAHRSQGESCIINDKEKGNLRLQLQEKTLYVEQLEKQVSDLQRTTEGPPVQIQVDTSQEKQELTVSPIEHNKSREALLAELEYQTNLKDKVLMSLEKERAENFTTIKDLKQKGEHILITLTQERTSKEDALSALDFERKAREQMIVDLEMEKRRKDDALLLLQTQTNEVSRLKKELEQKVTELVAKLTTAESQFAKEIQRAEDSSVQLHAAQTQINESSRKTEETISQILTLKREDECLRQAPNAVSHELIEEVSNVRSILVLQNQAQELKLAKEPHVTSDQEIQDFIDDQQSRQDSSQDLKETLCEQIYKQQVQELKEKLRDEELNSQMQLDQMKHKLNEQEETSRQLLEDMRQKFLKEEEISEQLKVKLGEVTSSYEELRKMNSGLQAEIQTLALKKHGDNASVKESQAELRENLSAMEKQVKSLQMSLEKALELKEEEVSRAVQKAQHQEVEKFQELLGVAHQAITQKDVELEKKTEEISRLQEKYLDIQRYEVETSDLRERLADYKKQIQQVQKEIASMRDQEKVLTLKFFEADKVKKQLQVDLANRDQTIKQQKVERMSSSKSDQMQKLYQKACDDLMDKERVLDGMRSALIEQEETQEQMDQMLVEKENVIQELSSELEKVRAILLRSRGTIEDGISEELVLVKKELNQAEESMKLSCEKQQSERKRWQEDKLSLISQVQEAENKRNQEMRKFAEDRERYIRQNGHLESELAKMELLMENWRKERDTLVAVLEVKLKKLLSSHEEKDQLIRELQQRKASSPPKVKRIVDPVLLSEMVQTDESQKSRAQSRPSVSNRVSTIYQSVLDSSEISTENGRTSRFPQPEMEISFSPLQPNHLALRRQGEENAVTIKITNAARKRKSGEMEKSHLFRRSKRRVTNKEDVDAENRLNTRTKLKQKLTVHEEEVPSPTGGYDSQASIKDGTLQRIGDFLQSSPTLLGSKAKKMMSLVSSRGNIDSLASPCSSSSLNLRTSKKKKMFRLEISSPMDIPSHPILTLEPEEKGTDFSIKRRLRSRIPK